MEAADLQTHIQATLPEGQDLVVSSNRDGLEFQVLTGEINERSVIGNHKLSHLRLELMEAGDASYNEFVAKFAPPEAPRWRGRGKAGAASVEGMSEV